MCVLSFNLWTVLNLNILRSRKNPSFQNYIQLHKVEYKYGVNRAQVNHKYPAILYSLLFCTRKMTCLTGLLHAFRFSNRFTFPALGKMSRNTWQKKKLDNK